MKTAYETLTELAPLFNNQCRVMLTGFTPKGFTIHHIKEIENDVLYKNYKGNRDRYLNDLKPLVEDCPERFALVTNPIHTKLDGIKNGITRLKIDNRRRFCDLAMETVRHQGRKKK